MLKYKLGEYEKVKNEGFTLLEIMLFLAISAALGAIALIGLGPRLRNVRFNQAVTSIQESTTLELSNLRSGLNPLQTHIRCEKQTSPGFWGYKAMFNAADPKDAGKNKECVLNGRVAVFRESKVTYYAIVSIKDVFSNDPQCANGTKTGVEGVLCFGPTVANAKDEYKKDVFYRNGVKKSGGSELVAVGQVKDPRGTGVYNFVYSKEGAKQFVNETGGSPKIKEADIEYGPSASKEVCLTLASRSAKLIYTTNSTTPEIVYDEGC